MMDEVASGKQGRLLCIMYSDEYRVPEKSIFEMGKSLKLPKMQFREKKF